MGFGVPSARQGDVVICTAGGVVGLALLVARDELALVIADVVGSVCPSSLWPEEDVDDPADFRIMRLKRSLIAILG